MIKRSGVIQSPDKTLLKLFNHGISNVQSKNILCNFIKVNRSSIAIKVNNRFIQYKKISSIFPICIGKASVDMAQTFNKITKKLKVLVHQGVIVVNKENAKKVNSFKTFIGGHPIPNQNGLKAAKYIKKYLENSKKNDLVLVLLSGGGSALLPYPVECLSLRDKVLINKQLIESGADIKEINTVRKHLSQIKGGNLLKFTYPSKVHCLILSDVVGDDLSSISSGLTSPDPTTFSKTKDILLKYKLWKKIPISIKTYIEEGVKNKELETPKKNNKIFSNVKNSIIGSNYLCIKSIHHFCKDNKIKSKIWFKDIEMDVKKLSLNFYQNLKKQNITKPIFLISGGETTVNIRGNGRGGRNQEFALHFLKIMKARLPKQKYFLLSAGTDGRDGPTDAAGAIINDQTHKILKSNSINLEKELKNNNSYEVLKKLKSLVIINGTNTNVADVQILYVF